MSPAARCRGDRDDAARFSLIHTGQNALDRQKSRGEIPIDGSAPTILAGLLNRPRQGKATAGVRNEDVNRSQSIFDLGFAWPRPDRIG